jgi:hypothetical protein
VDAEYLEENQPVPAVPEVQKLSELVWGEWYFYIIVYILYMLLHERTLLSIVLFLSTSNESNYLLECTVCVFTRRNAGTSNLGYTINIHTTNEEGNSRVHGYGRRFTRPLVLFFGGTDGSTGTDLQMKFSRDEGWPGQIMHLANRFLVTSWAGDRDFHEGMNHPNDLLRTILVVVSCAPYFSFDCPLFTCEPIYIYIHIYTYIHHRHRHRRIWRIVINCYKKEEIFIYIFNTNSY